MKRKIKKNACTFREGGRGKNKEGGGKKEELSMKERERIAPLIQGMKVEGTSSSRALAREYTNNVEGTLTQQRDKGRGREGRERMSESVRETHIKTR